MSVSQDDQEKEIIARMTKYFVPIDTTDLKNIVPKNDRILCSLIVAGKLAAQPRPSHVILTASGIAYRFLSTTNKFSYWHSRPSQEIKLKKSMIRVDMYKMAIKNTVKDLYTESEYSLLQENFASYCKILSQNFQNRINEMRDLAENEELLKSKIINTETADFLKTIRIFYYAGFHDEVFSIVEKTLNIIPDGENIGFLHFSAEIHTKKLNVTNRQYVSSKNNFHLILPHFEKTIPIYERILEQDPNNSEILRKKENLQEAYKNYSIPYDIQERSYMLYEKGIRKYQQGKYPKALHYYKESYRLVPNSPELKEQIIDLLKKLGRKEDISLH